MSVTTVGPFDQGSTMRYTAVLQDETGAGVGSGSVTTLTVTVYAVLPGSPIVNGIDHANILNVGRGTLDASGNLVMTLAPADMGLLNGLGAPEVHVVLIEWTYNAGTKGGSHQVSFTVNPVTRY